MLNRKDVLFLISGISGIAAAFPLPKFGILKTSSEALLSHAMLIGIHLTFK